MYKMKETEVKQVFNQLIVGALMGLAVSAALFGPMILGVV